jgi:nucleoside-diphosphate-sugar epimerase
MKVVVTGATGNVGTSLVEALSEDDAVTSIVGLARRRPGASWPKVSWIEADVTRDDLTTIFRGADAVVHLAWLIQPSRDEAILRRTNVDGSRRTFEAVATAGVPSLIYASSIGAYSPGPKDRAVDETWPTNGISTSFYARHKAEVERILDRFEADHPSIRVVRLRKALVFKREAASGVRRLFFGPLLPGSLLRRKLIPAIPNIDRLVFQVVHSKDAGEAYRLATTGDARGAFNIAADPVLDPPGLAELLEARLVKMSPRVLRGAMTATWRAHLQPTPPGWLDMGLGVPVMDTERARIELGWKPRRNAREALLELMDGLRTGAGIDTPPLSPHTGGPFRLREFVTGVGRTSR